MITISIRLRITFVLRNGIIKFVITNIIIEPTIAFKSSGISSRSFRYPLAAHIEIPNITASASNVVNAAPFCPHNGIKAKLSIILIVALAVVPITTYFSWFNITNNPLVIILAVTAKKVQMIK